MDKAQAIETIKSIQTGGGTPNRDTYPKKWVGDYVEWRNHQFHLGMEYGYILALMHIFNISKEEVEK